MVDIVTLEEDLEEIKQTESKIELTPEEEKKRWYLDNKKLYDVLVEWKEAREDADKYDLPMPRIPDYVGEAILNICSKMVTRHNFNSYTFRDDMRSAAILQCTKYIKNFNPFAETKSGKPNPFGYITKIAWQSCITVINSEQEVEYTKLLALQDAQGFLAEGGGDIDHNTESTIVAEMMQNDSSGRMEKFREKFGDPTEMKRKKRKQRTKIVENSLDRFTEEQDNAEYDDTLGWEEPISDSSDI